jgi:hypothetical protein
MFLDKGGSYRVTSVGGFCPFFVVLRGFFVGFERFLTALDGFFGSILHGLTCDLRPDDGSVASGAVNSDGVA